MDGGALKGDPPPAAPGSAEEVVMPVLSAAQAEQVGTLFKAWDIDSIGKLPLANFSGASIPIGPHESGVLTKLRDMDYDGDGSVTKEVRVCVLRGRAFVSDCDARCALDARE